MSGCLDFGIPARTKRAAALALVAIIASVLANRAAQAQTVDLDGAQSSTPGVTRGVEEGAAVALSPELEAQVSTSAVGLLARPSVVAGGGVVVDLQGSFRNLITATVALDGTLASECVALAHEHESGAPEGR